MRSLLIRAEDKNIWERRSTLVPSDLKKIHRQVDIKSFIEKSEKRYFKEDDYNRAGAESCTGMEPGDIVFGVKEIPEEKILNNKVYLYFSHTIKGQQENMAMLRRIMDSGSSLIDYEKITDEQGRRKVFFGPYAGDTGAIDILWLLGEKWQKAGIETPFSEVKQALHYESVKDAKEKLSKIGMQLKQDGFPAEAGRVVIGILGYGNVAKGAMQIFECFPHEYIAPEELVSFVQSGKAENNKIYLTVFKEEHLVVHRENKKFQLQEYYDHPENYKAQFKQYLPYLTILLNATYWEPRYPKFVTWDDLYELFSAEAKPRLSAIADITCDVNGSVECNVKSTGSGMPAYRVFPLQRTTENGHVGDGIVLLAVDNLPAELPKDASEFFSKNLTPFVAGIMTADFDKPLDQSGLPEEIKRAVIVYNGRLTKDFDYLNEFLA